ncbi:WXG100 family type VII secretion target [Nocardia arthritidis]|uniref:WXG100 family type VII secretion target n=1 Tax=Nocardia arthritidis TaxID=228602 RepID=UPI001EEC7CE9|nr:WXG100 family type VII secretion target [Nocardia arthritidis]
MDLTQLDEAIEAMASFGTEVDGILADVDRHVADLHLSWSSDAAQAQRAAHDRWMAGAAEMRENLDELREVAHRAHTHYSEVGRTNEGMWP